MDQGRLFRVIMALMVAMTVGALVLLALEGKPIQPMPAGYSLSSQVQLSSISSVLKTDRVDIDVDRWRSIEISYEPNDGRLSRRLGPTGSLAIVYHFVIGNGGVGRDGQIYQTQRWIKQLNCLNTPHTDHTIRICLIRDGSDSPATSSQSRQLDTLVKNLAKLCRIDLKSI